ncbi:YlaI family protein [Bacillus sp. S/N-304-OC-R1]|uniref:YlaI family protein n=1 Tax=Bacillus sp. S/N-304-OC-R1 TaxID=2758034 RepID=UPI001C8E9792|nr:YlaI family protein [Bacillus sp. S/N-304-OC-R1]MBY0120847.1 YlaI family protein [Bacillus sp. S/N-304-OC-R1]
MRVKCVLCDKIESIEDHSFQAKRLRNRPIHTYMCKECEARITEKTQKRLQSGNFKLYQSNVKEEEW